MKLENNLKQVMIHTKLKLIHIIWHLPSEIMSCFQLGLNIFPITSLGNCKLVVLNHSKVLNWVGPDAYANKFHFITKVAPPNIEDLGAYKGPENISFDTSMSFPMIPLQTL